MKKNIQKLLVVSLSVMFGFVMAACDGTNNSNSNSNDPATDSSSPVHEHSYTSSVTKEATCTEKGVMTYSCECGDSYTEEIATKAHELTHHAAVEKTCDVAGSVEHWVCEGCNAYYLDAEGTQATTAEAVVVPASHGTLTHVQATAKTCTTAGNVEHWVCEDCDVYYLDAKATQATTAEEVVIPAHTIEHYESREATCETNGNIEYWFCAACNKYYSDSELLTEVSYEDTVITAPGHNNEYQVVSATIGETAVVKYSCACGHEEAIYEVAAPSSYKSVVNETNLEQYFTIDNSYPYTFAWENGVLTNGNKEVASSTAYYSLTALSSGTLTFDVAVCSESNYDHFVVYNGTSTVYSSKQSGQNGVVISKTVTIEVSEGDEIKFSKTSDSSGFYGGDYANISNITFSSTIAPTDVEYVVVSFNTTGGEAVNPVVAIKGQMVESLPKATRNDYFFVEWTIDSENTTAYDVNTILNENTILYASWLSAADACPLYGSYMGKNVYGANFANGNYSLTIDALGNISGYFTGTVTGYDPETNIVTWTDGTSTGQFIYDEVTGTIASSSRLKETVNLSTDFYMFTRASESLTANAVAFYDVNEYYTIKLVEFTADSNETYTVLVKDNQIYPNVTYTSLFTENPTIATMKNISDVVVKDAEGNVLVAQGYNGKKYVNLDDAYGIYTNGENTLKVSGITNIDLNGVVGTYVYEDNIVKATIDGTYYHITLDGSTYTSVVPMTTVMFDSVQGSTVENRDVNTTMTIGELPTPTREGFVFMGWYDNADYTGSAITSSYVVEGETVTVYAKWLEKVTVTFETNGGSELDAIDSASGLAIEEPAQPTRDGYRFDGYYLDNETFLNDFEFANGVTENTLVYVKWVKVWTVTIYPNNGDETPTVVVVDDGTSYEVPSFVNSGSEFEGWYTTSSFDVNSKYTSGTPVTGDVTIYANWETGKYTNDAANFIDKFDSEAKFIETITFEDSYPWSVETYKDELWMISTNKGIGSSKSTISFTMASAANLAFDYCTSSEYRWDFLKVYINDVEVVNTKNLASSTEYSGTYSALVAAGDVIKFEYSKDGSGNNGNDKAYVNNFVFTELAKVEVTLNYNDGVTPDGSLEADSGVAVSLPTTATREGYVFKGWMTTADGSEVVSSSYVAEESITLYAKWVEALTVTIVYGNGLDNGEETVASGEAPELAIDSTFVNGKGFVGWYTDVECTIPYNYEVITESTSIYAKWVDAVVQYGTYAGANVYGAPTTGAKINGGYPNYSISIDAVGNVTNDKNGTITDYNAETGAFKIGTSYASYDEVNGVLVYSSGKEALVADMYIYVKDATKAACNNAGSQWNKGLTKLVTFTLNDTTTMSIFIYDNRIYGNVTWTSTQGEVTAANAYNATDLTVYDSTGAQIVYFKNVTGKGLSLMDEYVGTYTVGSDVIVFDGYGAGTFNDETLTYKIEGTQAIVTTSGSVYYYAYDAQTKTLTALVADVLAAKTFSATYSTCPTCGSYTDTTAISFNGFGNATIAVSCDCYDYCGCYPVFETNNSISASYTLVDNVVTVTLSSNWTVTFTLDDAVTPTSMTCATTGLSSNHDGYFPVGTTFAAN